LSKLIKPYRYISQPPFNAHHVEAGDLFRNADGDKLFRVGRGRYAVAVLIGYTLDYLAEIFTFRPQKLYAVPDEEFAALFHNRRF
jgi:hypothetical protein